MIDLMEPFYSKETKKNIKQTQLILKNLNSQRNKDLFKKLELIFNPEINTVDGRIFYAGDIIFRPLDIVKDDYNLDLNHYGIVLGTAYSGEKLILHISPKYNVEIVSLYKFLSKHNLSNLQVERKPQNISFEEIIDRAKEVKNEIYSATNFNCRHFVNYCVYDKKESLAVQNVSNVVSPFLELVSKYLNYKASFQADEHKAVLLKLAKSAEDLYLEIKGAE